MVGPLPFPVVDTHVHLWDARTYHRLHGDWLDARPELKRSWLPADLERELAACGVERAVIVEAARDSHSLNRWWLKQAEAYGFLGPVVAGCRLEQPDLARWLDDYSASPHLAGVRCLPAGRPHQWTENPATLRGLAELAGRGLCLELLVEWPAFPAVGRLAARFPGLPIILDHCGAPPFPEGPEALDAWAAGLRELAARENVTVKYASLLLYADPQRDSGQLCAKATFLLDLFGPDRLMWGSNWPVELRYGSYLETFQFMRACAGSLTLREQRALFGGTAVRVYGISASVPEMAARNE